MEFTDYELYQILDENDYAPSAENLQILKENPEILDELFGYAVTAKGLGKQISKDSNRIDRINNALADENLSDWRRNRLKAELAKKSDRMERNNTRVSKK